MRLALPAGRVRELEAHLERFYPEEGCGVLLGRDAGGMRRVERVIGFENRQGDSRRRRYLIEPEQFLRAEREAREAALEVVGFFHSHPDYPARPSAFDLEHAWPYYSYLIVSVQRGRAVEANSWRLDEDRSRFVPESVDILAEPGAAAPAPAGEREKAG